MSARSANASRIAFAASLVVLGGHALATGGIAAVWGPVPRFVPAQAALPGLIGVLVAACGLGLLWRRTTPLAARVLTGWLLLWLLLARLAEAAMAPAVEGLWSGCGETLVPAAAAWMLQARSGDRGRVVARMVYGIALIPFGLAHFVYFKETESLVPAGLPAPGALALLTGAAYIAAGCALLTGVCARLAAVLVALQIGGFTALVWLPALASGHADASSVSETVISLMLTAAACVIANAVWHTAEVWNPASSSETPVG